MSKNSSKKLYKSNYLKDRRTPSLELSKWKEYFDNIFLDFSLKTKRKSVDNQTYYSHVYRVSVETPSPTHIYKRHMYKTLVLPLAVIRYNTDAKKVLFGNREKDWDDDLFHVVELEVLGKKFIIESKDDIKDVSKQIFAHYNSTNIIESYLEAFDKCSYIIAKLGKKKYYSNILDGCLERRSIKSFNFSGKRLSSVNLYINFDEKYQNFTFEIKSKKYRVSNLTNKHMAEHYLIQSK